MFFLDVKAKVLLDTNTYWTILKIKSLPLELIPTYPPHNIFALKKIPALVFSSIVQWPWRCVFLRVFDLLIPNSLTYASDVNLDAPLSIFKFKSLTVISARAFKNIYLSPGDAQKSNHHKDYNISDYSKKTRAIVFIVIGCELINPVNLE